jgi:predicted unusual protein kinase regulating ubiquinone biosynthesis (AarF/ABC1/UbiB family)
VLLDFGLAKTLPSHFREKILAFATAIIGGQAELIVEAFVALGFETRDGSHESLVEVASFALEFAQRAREGGWQETRTFARWNEELGEQMRSNPIVRIPSHVVLLGRVMGLLSGVSKSLGSRLDLLPVVMPWVLGAAPGAAPAEETRPLL